MSKLFITHFYPDLDGISGIWMFKRFGGRHYKNAKVEFVSAGSTWNNQAADSDSDIIHIDTGHGLFDHHDENEYTSASRKVFEHLNIEDETLERLVDQVTALDHFAELNWPDPLDDRYDFHLVNILQQGWKVEYPNQHQKYVEWICICLDGVYTTLKNKIAAQKSLEENAQIFESIWGPAAAIQTFNDDVLKVGQKMGYALIVRKDPLKHYVRIKGRADRDDIDLTVIYEKLKALDPEATWFLHPDRKQLLNGNTKNPNNVYTKLSLEDVVEILKVR